MKHHFLLTTSAIVLTAATSYADKVHTEQIKFEAGKSSATISGKVTGGDTGLYKLNAKEGQFLKMSMTTDKESSDFNIYIPGSGQGDEALFTSATGGRNYTGQLYKTGDHSITVFLNRAAARKGGTATYKLHVAISDKQPVEKEEKPATGAVPELIIDDCKVALREQLGRKPMKLIQAKRGENSYIVDFQVDGSAKPWRCFHNGTKCTGTEYQGEG
jgi:hypothetical protein